MTENTREEISLLLEEHLSFVTPILKRDGMLMPFLRIEKEGEQGILAALAPADPNGTMDVDRAYQKALELVETEHAKRALFSYSTDIMADGQQFHTIKTVFFFEGEIITLYTPFIRKGWFRKEIIYGETMRV